MNREVRKQGKRTGVSGSGEAAAEMRSTIRDGVALWQSTAVPSGRLWRGVLPLAKVAHVVRQKPGEHLGVDVDTVTEPRNDGPFLLRSIHTGNTR